MKIITVSLILTLLLFTSCDYDNEGSSIHQADSDFEEDKDAQEYCDDFENNEKEEFDRDEEEIDGGDVYDQDDIDQDNDSEMDRLESETEDEVNAEEDVELESEVEVESEEESGLCAPLYALTVSDLPFANQDSTINGVNQINVERCAGHYCEGPDDLYKIYLEAGTHIVVNADADFNISLYIVKSCDDDSECYDSSLKTIRNRETLFFAPEESGNYWIVVDSCYGEEGHYSLDIRNANFPTANDNCDSAIPIMESSQILGDLSLTEFENDYDPGVTGCRSGAGKDAVYMISLNPGEGVQVDWIRFSAYQTFYFVTDCQDIERTCIGTELECENVYYNTTDSVQTVYLIVDGLFEDHDGVFSIAVDFLELSVNDTCESATELTNPFSISGNTLTALDDEQTELFFSEGPDLFYNLSIPPRKTLRLWFDDVETYVGMYRKFTCDGEDFGIHNQRWFLNPEQSINSYFIPNPSEDPLDTLVVIDSSGCGYYTFNLSGETMDFDMGGETCEQAIPIGTSTFLEGTLSGRTDDHSPQDYNCTIEATDAPEMVYTLELLSGHGIDFQITSPTSTEDKKIYLTNHCNPLEAICLSQSDENGYLTYSNTSASTQTLYFFIEGKNLWDNYPFQIAIEERELEIGDICESALPIISGTTMEGNTFNAGNDYSNRIKNCVEEYSACWIEGPEVVYSILLPAGEGIVASLENEFQDAVLYGTDNCDNLFGFPDSCLTFAMDQERSEQITLVNLDDYEKTYFIFVDGMWSSTVGTFTLNIDPALEGDICETAIPIEVGNSYQNDTRLFAANYGQRNLALDTYSLGKDIVYTISVEPESSIKVTCTSSFSDVDPIIYASKDCLNLIYTLAAGANRSDGPEEWFILENRSNETTTYYIFVDGFFRG